MRRSPVLIRAFDRVLQGDLSRRAWMRQALAGLSGLSLLTRDGLSSEALTDARDADEIAKVQGLLKHAGLVPIEPTQTVHFLGLGDANSGYSKNALTICESLAEALLSHLRDRGFKVAMPRHRMTVITLKDDASYHAFLGKDPGPTVGGHYDLETNRLVVFDFRDKQAEFLESAPRVNLFTLIHEGIHLLSYNTGLLSLQMDVPACISEGLATYGELWRPKGKARIGSTNGERLKVLFAPQGGAQPWIPIPDLLADDALIDKAETEQLAYAESWLLVHYLLERDSQQLPRFRSYLANINAPLDVARRLRCAEVELGSLKSLDKEVARHAKAQTRKAR
jgi:hypothetical protein